MKKHKPDLRGQRYLRNFLPPSPLRRKPLLACIITFILSLGIVFFGGGHTRFSAEDLQEFAVGKVAERDVIADHSVSYIDEAATEQLLEAQEKLIPAVFAYSPQISQSMGDAYTRFCSLFEQHGHEYTEPNYDAFAAEAEALFPAAFSQETLRALYFSPNREHLLAIGDQVLEYLLELGVFILPPGITEIYNSNYAELWHNYGPRTEREQISFDQIIIVAELDETIRGYIADYSLPLSYVPLVTAAVKPFITENVFFSPDATAVKVLELHDRMDPVVKHIDQGKLIIRKGFIITEDEYMQLQALSGLVGRRDIPAFLGQALALLLLFGFFVFLAGQRSLQRILKPSEIYFLCAATVCYLGGAFILKSISLFDQLPVAFLLPTSLLVMLAAFLISPAMGTAMGILLPLSALLSGPFDLSSYIFALSSGIAAAFVYKGVEHRVDLIRSGALIALVNVAAGLVILLLNQEPLERYPLVMSLGIINGIAAGVLTLGMLPLLENLLNSATAFRLIELSDLNAPILKKLFSVAPGTYSHSIMVANLAETACQEINANPLLARVGAYYHDIGKMDQPDYFVENQGAHNKHDEIGPRLSATVIRSHVKLGVEKARSLGLPKEVVDIIAEHHGNSVIRWFYNEALKQEGQVNIEDFSYPGKPPLSRESAVVMLADVTEAATRTLKKPTASRLERFIHELIVARFEHGQLADSVLTFRDLESIKNSFVRVLAGYYHSRIEYPNQPKTPGEGNGEAAEDDEDEAPREALHHRRRMRNEPGNGGR